MIQNSKIHLILELLNTIEKLRSKDGCPWDKKQTHQTLSKYLEEEAWEVIDAIKQKKEKEELKEELGDVLLQVVMHSEIAKEKNNFDFYKVVEHLNQKLIHRHPHVFDKENIGENFDIEKEWDKIKEKELGKKYHPLQRIPNAVSLEYLLKKIVSYEKQIPQELNTKDLQEKIQILKKEKTKKKREELLGNIFYELACWAESQQISWSDFFRKKIEQKKEKMVQKLTKPKSKLV